MGRDWIDFSLGGVHIVRASPVALELERALQGYKLVLVLRGEAKHEVYIESADAIAKCDTRELCHLAARPGRLPDRWGPGGTLAFRLESFITAAHLDAINSTRRGASDLVLTADIVLVGRVAGKSAEPTSREVTTRVSRSDWLTKLQSVGHFDALLVELSLPGEGPTPAMGDALAQLQEARKRLGDHGTTSVLESLKAVFDDLESCFGAADAPRLVRDKPLDQWTARDRMDATRWVLRRLVGHAGHGGAARDIDVSDATAEAAFIMVTGLLRWAVAQPTEGSEGGA